MHEGLYTRGYARGGMHEALCTRGHARGAIHPGLCTSGYARGAMDEELCMRGDARGAMHEGPCTRGYTQGAMHEEVCTRGYTRRTIHEGQCTRGYARGAIHEGRRYCHLGQHELSAPSRHAHGLQRMGVREAVETQRGTRCSQGGLPRHSVGFVRRYHAISHPTRHGTMVAGVEIASSAAKTPGWIALFLRSDDPP